MKFARRRTLECGVDDKAKHGAKRVDWNEGRGQYLDTVYQSTVTKAALTTMFTVPTNTHGLFILMVMKTNSSDKAGSASATTRHLTLKLHPFQLEMAFWIGSFMTQQDSDQLGASGNLVCGDSSL